MELWELEARDEIRELLAAYTHDGDGGRIDEMSNLFTADAVLDAFGSLYTGRTAIAGFFGGIADGSSPAPPRSFIRHHISNVAITIDTPTRAVGASYWLVIADDGLESSGRYWDTYRRLSEGPWRFATRKIRRDRSRLPKI